MASEPVREVLRTRPMVWAASYISRVISGSCVGWSDQTHVLGGLSMPRLLPLRLVVALRFHTM
ncbi:hypothetical protein [Nonomuraea insulae]|uniref:Uncharacterized protein n=1 Tax=Nonomuraea insulae TaxID=1616787 RepID=A0ABW1D104_9ACTN